MIRDEGTSLKSDGSIHISQINIWKWMHLVEKDVAPDWQPNSNLVITPYAQNKQKRGQHHCKISFYP